MQCCGRVIKCCDNTSAFRFPLCCDIVKCHDNLSTVILHSALSLLRHSSACCDKLLQVALGFCHDIVKLCRDIFHFPALAIFATFSTIFACFALKPCKI